MSEMEDLIKEYLKNSLKIEVSGRKCTDGDLVIEVKLLLDDEVIDVSKEYISFS
jgi:hypothetical protein